MNSGVFLSLLQDFAVREILQRNAELRHQIARWGNRPEPEVQHQGVTLLRDRCGVMVGSRFRVTGVA